MAEENDKAVGDVALDVPSEKTEKPAAKPAAKKPAVPKEDNAAKAEKKPAAPKADSAAKPADKKPVAPKKTEVAEKKGSAETEGAEKAAPKKKAAPVNVVKIASKKAKTVKAPKTGYKLRLVKSFSGRLDSQIATVKSLGLFHVGDVAYQPDNAATVGKINKVAHMLEIIKL